MTAMTTPSTQTPSTQPPSKPPACDAGTTATLMRRQWTGGWRRWLFPGLWLVYLGQVIGGLARHTSGVGLVAGLVILAAFSFCYLVALPTAWTEDRRRFWLCFAAMLVLTALESIFAHEDALVMCVYICVLAVAGLGRWGLATVAALTVVTVAAPPLVPAWHHPHIAWDSAITLPLVALAMYGFFAIIRSNRELTRARAEVARLAAENERTRIARDLHDLLGHSLTTITVKAGLARRLSERDPARAAEEIAEVEELTRRSLAQVRAAVAGYREVTLAGELATSREVLRSAGILPEVPRAVDDVDPAYDELFGWVLREGVTNVVRHARASRCSIAVGRTWLEVSDDGRGGVVGPDDGGHGLTGIRERTAALGGQVRAAAGTGQGWTLRVQMPTPPPANPDNPEPDSSAPLRHGAISTAIASTFRT